MVTGLIIFFVCLAIVKWICWLAENTPLDESQQRFWEVDAKGKPWPKKQTDPEQDND